MTLLTPTLKTVTRHFEVPERQDLGTLLMYSI